MKQTDQWIQNEENRKQHDILKSLSSSCIFNGDLTATILLMKNYLPTG